MTKLLKLDIEMLMCHMHHLSPIAKGGLMYAIPDNKNDKRPIITIWGFFDEVMDQLEELNNDGYGIFICVNETEDKSRRTSNITRVRAIFHDDDGGGLPLPLPPSMIIESGGVTKDGRPKLHSYYFTTDQLTHDDYLGMMPVMSDKYGGDPAVKDLPRLMRMAGTYHWKTGTPRKVKIISEGQKYTRAELLKAFPPQPVRKSTNNKNSKNTGTATLSQCRSGLVPDNIGLSDVHEIVTDLFLLDPDCDYNTWIKMGIILKNELGDRGFQLWDLWSSLGKKYEMLDMTSKWKGFKR